MTKKEHTYISEQLLKFDTSDMERLREYCRRASFQLRDAAYAFERIENELDVSADRGIAPRRPILRRLAANAADHLCWEDDEDPVVAARHKEYEKESWKTFIECCCVKPSAPSNGDTE
jgi:hypothetical protein